MTGPIETALIAVIAIGVWLRYRHICDTYAMLLRERMVHRIMDLKSDSSLSDDFKESCLWLFHISLKPNLVPWLVWITVKAMLLRNAQRMALSHRERDIWHSLLTRHAIVVNMVSAPHWYILLAMLLVLFMLAIGVIKMLRLQSISNQVESILSSEVLRHRATF